MLSRIERKPAQSTYSVLDSKFLTGAGTSMIGVYFQDDSRTIYVESGMDPDRLIKKYELRFPHWLSGKPPATQWNVTVYNSHHVHQIVREIRELTSKRERIEVCQVSSDKLSLFCATLESFRHSQQEELDKECDDCIRKAFKAADLSIDIPDYVLLSNGCSIL